MKHSKFLLINIGLFIICIIGGYFFLRDCFGWGDSLNMFSPFPRLSMSDITKTAASFWGYICDWYTGQNGRLNAALVNGLIFEYSRHFVPSPEQFPWWAVRASSIFCLFAIPLNIACLFYRYGIKLQGATVAFLFIWVFWSINPVFFESALWFDSLLTDRFLPMFVLSILLLAMAGGKAGSYIGGLFCLSAYFYLSFEQMLLSLPIILAGIVLTRGREYDGASMRRLLFLGIILTAVAAAIYFLSPGQRFRNSLIGVSLPALSFDTLSKWYAHSINLNYRMLFFQHPNKYFWVIFHTAITALIIGFAITEFADFLKSKASFLSARRQLTESHKILILIFAFFLGFHLSMSTLLVSGYFPAYATQYPSLLLMTYLFLAGVFFYSKVSLSLAVKRSLYFCMLAGICFYTVGNSAKAVKNGEYILFQNRLRRIFYRRIVSIEEESGERNFILTNLPRSLTKNVLGQDVTLESPWGYAAYFRWIRKPEIFVVDEQNYDYESRPQNITYMILDYRKL